MNPDAIMSNIALLKSKQAFYISQADKLTWKPCKQRDDFESWKSRIPINRDLISSLSGATPETSAKYECIMVRVKGRINQTMAKCVADLRNDDVSKLNDDKFKFICNNTICNEIVPVQAGKKPRPTECTWVRDVRMKSPVPILKDQQLISYAYQNVVPAYDRDPSGNFKMTETLSHSLKSSEIVELFGAGQDTVYSSKFTQGHEIITQIRLTPLYDANTGVTIIEHYGVYCAPNTPSLLYEDLLAKTIAQKYANFANSYKTKAH
jgi:hypothetical protein